EFETEFGSGICHSCHSTIQQVKESSESDHDRSLVEVLGGNLQIVETYYRVEAAIHHDNRKRLDTRHRFHYRIKTAENIGGGEQTRNDKNAFAETLTQSAILRVNRSIQYRSGHRLRLGYVVGFTQIVLRRQAASPPTLPLAKVAC